MKKKSNMDLNNLGNFGASLLSGILLLLILCVPGAGRAKEGGKVFVVSTLTDYAAIAREIGGDRTKVEAIAAGDEDSHFVRPKPSFAQKLAKADLFVTTGLDLELWAPSVIDKSQNPNIREGQIGYVAVSDGLKLLEIPAIVDRSQGGVHVYGNPHIHTSPLNAKTIATNIAIGLKKVDPEGADYYAGRLKQFKGEIDKRLFGEELIEILGAKTLTRLAESGNLVSFLEGKEFKGEKLIAKLDGWLKEMMPLRGRKLVTYHKNWIYFTELFGFEVVGEVEPKPSIPPSPRDVEKLIQMMKKLDVKVVLAANFYDEHKVNKICRAVGATPVIVPMSVEGIPTVKTYFDLIDNWVAMLKAGYGVK
jgi:zinc/manganese transport system substrate-binding protein